MEHTKLIRKTNEDIRKQQEDYEAATVVTKEGQTIADLRQIADAVFDQNHWKNPWAAYVPHDLVGPVMRAVEFFHGTRPRRWSGFSRCPASF